MHFSRTIGSLPAWAALAALGWVLVPQSALAQGYSFTAFDYPGAYYTIADSLNNSGQIVGSYGVTDSNGNQTTSGFTGSAASLSSAGLTSYSTGDAFSELTAINNAGLTAGDYEKSDGTNPGFLLVGQSHVDFLPSGYSSIVPFGINTAAVVSGTATDTSGIALVFVRSSAGTFTFLNDTSADAFGTNGGGNNDAGTVVGSYTNSAGASTAFTESGGVFTNLTIPLSVSAAAFDIDNQGDIVGQYRTGDTQNPSQGFLLTASRTLITVNVPGAVSTELRGVNDSLQLVGDYTDANGNVHAFFATPAPEPSQYAAFAIGVLGIGLLGLRARTSSNDGESQALSTIGSPAATIQLTEANSTLGTGSGSLNLWNTDTTDYAGTFNGVTWAGHPAGNGGYNDVAKTHTGGTNFLFYDDHVKRGPQQPGREPQPVLLVSDQGQPLSVSASPLGATPRI